MRCGTIRRTLCANKRPNCSRHVAHEAQCARPRCAKAPSRRTGHGGGPRLANVARARESGLQGDADTLHDAEDCRTCPNIRHLILKCPNIHERAQLGLGSRYASSHPGDIWGWQAQSYGNQTIKCRTEIKQSKSHEYHFPIPLVFRIKTIKIPGKSR